MLVELSCWLPRRPEWVWEHVQRSETLDYVAGPLIRFVPKNGCFPDGWEDGRYRASMWLFGIIPMGWQEIGIEYPEDAHMSLRDNGRGMLAKNWDHWIVIEPEGGGTRYTDRVDVEAGVLTPFVALFARIFYGHRQRRWKQLAKSTKTR